MTDLMIIETKNSQLLKSILDAQKINYNLLYIHHNIHNGRDRQSRALYEEMQLASKDEARNREIAEWDKLQDEDDRNLGDWGDDWN